MKRNHIPPKLGCLPGTEMKIKKFAKKNLLVALDNMYYHGVKAEMSDVGLACKESTMLFLFMWIVFIVLRSETNINYIIQCGKPLAFHKKKFYLQWKAFDLEDFMKSLLSLILVVCVIWCKCQYQCLEIMSGGSPLCMAVWYIERVTFLNFHFKKLKLNF